MISTWRYEISRNSAIRKAAAPSVGGDSSAPMPAADSTAPLVSAPYPARRSIGQATEPSVTVVATPLPETVPRRKPATVTLRPGAAPDRERPIAANDQSMKKRPAPECSRTAP
jgi:hypothetical protein